MMRETIFKVVNRLRPYFLSLIGDNKISGNIYPSQANTYDLGSSELPFRSIHASSIIGASSGSTVKSSVNDSSDGYLFDKVTVASPITKSLVGASGTPQTVQIGFDGADYVPSTRQIIAANGIQVSPSVLSDGVTGVLSNDLTISTKLLSTGGLDNTTALGIKRKSPNSGLVLDSAGIAVGAGTMMSVSGTTVGITAGSNYQFIGTGSGTTASWISMETLEGNGILHTNGALSIKTKTTSGLVLDANGLAVGAGTLITVGTNTVGISTGAAHQYIGTASGTTAGWRNLSALAGDGISFDTVSDTFHLDLSNTVDESGGGGLSLTNGNKTILLSGAFNPGRVADKFLATGPFGGLQLAQLDSTTGFTSGFAGSGYRIIDRESGSSDAEFDNLTIRGRLRVYELLIQQIRATNGSVFVTSASKAGKVTLVSGTTYEIDTRDGDADDDEPTETKHYHSFFVNDLIRAQRVQFDPLLNGGDGGYEVVRQVNLRVTSVISQYVFRAIIVDVGGLTTVPRVGDELVRIGNTTNVDRQGSVYITSDDSFAPFIDVKDGVTSFDGATTGFNAYQTTKARLGKLEGITDPVFGALSGYGLFSENAYLTGKIVALADSQIAGWDITSTAIRKEIVSPGRLVEIDSSGNPSIGLYNGYGGIMLQTNYASGVDSDIMWAKSGVNWDTSTDADFRVTSAGRLFARNADIEGKITSTEGDIGGWIITDSSIEKERLNSNSILTSISLISDPSPRIELFNGAGGVVMTAGDTGYGSEVVLWVKSGAEWNTSSTGANFSVAANGAISATYATISGEIHVSEGGSIGDWEVVNVSAGTDPGVLRSQGIQFDPARYSGSTLTSPPKIEVGAGVGSTPPGGWGETLPALRAGLSGGYGLGDVVFWAGASYANRAGAPFRVTIDGQVTATSAVISGSYNLDDVGSISAAITVENNGKINLVGANSAIYSGKTTWGDSTDGWWIGRESNVAMFHFGNTDRYIRWNGSDLIIHKPQITTDWTPVTYYGTLKDESPYFGDLIWSDYDGNIDNRLTWARLGDIVMVRGWIQMMTHGSTAHRLDGSTYIVARDLPAPAANTFVPSRASLTVLNYLGHTSLQDAPIVNRGDVFEVQQYVDGVTKGQLALMINLGGTATPQVPEANYILNFTYRAA